MDGFTSMYESAQLLLLVFLGFLTTTKQISMPVIPKAVGSTCLIYIRTKFQLGFS